MTDLSRVRVTGPLEPFAAGFAAELVDQGYSLQPAALQLRLLAHLSRWLAAERRDAAGVECGRGRGVPGLASCGRLLDASWRTHRCGRCWCICGGSGVVPVQEVLAPAGPVEVALARYRRYLVVERGLNEITVRVYVDAVRPFLVGRVAPDGLGLDLRSLGAGDVTAFVVARCPAQPRGAAKQTVTALRSLLVYLHVEGEIGRPLAAAVPSVAGWRLAGLPKGLEPGEVQASVGVMRPRDSDRSPRLRAIVTMLVRLGLRAGEVAALTLDDVDWRVWADHGLWQG